jgi:holo-[acyl-carrier protein] synthase
MSWLTTGERTERAIMEVIGVGTDLVDVDRFRATLRRTPNVAYRVFTVDERNYCDQRRDPIERYAVRFAAKEATLKSMGLGIFAVPLTQIEVVRSDDGSPSVELHAKAADLAAEMGVDGLRVSLTHTATMAHAVVMALSFTDGSDRNRP